jgi:hypothetical protein
VKRIDSLLGPFIRELGIEEGVRLAEIKRDWFSLFNEPLSYHMSPFMLSEGEITLNVDSPVWLQQLNFYKEDITKKLSSYGVKSVRFRLGKVSTRKISNLKSQISNLKPLTEEECSYIEETVLQINDEALREVVRRAIEKSLTSGRRRQ